MEYANTPLGGIGYAGNSAGASYNDIKAKLGYAAAQVSAQAPSQIDSSVARLEGAGSELRSLVAGLQVKLQNVLMPQMKEAGSSGANSATPVVSPLANRLDGIEADLLNSGRLLRDLYDRLAV